MEKLSWYDIPISGLSEGKHVFDYQLKQSFFNLFEFQQEFTEPTLKVLVEIERHRTHWDLVIQIDGIIKLIGDFSNLSYQEEIKNKTEILIKLGEETDLSDDAVWLISTDEKRINVAQQLFELSLLMIPNRKIHPEYRTGDKKKEIEKMLEKYAPGQKKLKTNEEKESIWAALRKLKDLN